MNLKFAEFELDPGNGELRRAGEAVPISRQAARVLALLIDRRGATVSRQEIRSHIWPDVHVGFEDSINTAIRQVRTALGDSAAHPRFVGTVRGEGYRFLYSSALTGRFRVTRPHLVHAIALFALLLGLAVLYLSTRTREIIIDQTIEATVTVAR